MAREVNGPNDEPGQYLNARISKRLEPGLTKRGLRALAPAPLRVSHTSRQTSCPSSPHHRMSASTTYMQPPVQRNVGQCRHRHPTTRTCTRHTEWHSSGKCDALHIARIQHPLSATPTLTEARNIALPTLLANPLMHRIHVAMPADKLKESKAMSQTILYAPLAGKLSECRSVVFGPIPTINFWTGAAECARIRPQLGRVLPSHLGTLPPASPKFARLSFPNDIGPTQGHQRHWTLP